MEYFVVMFEQGPQWDSSLSMREQKMWDNHARFMDSLVDEAFVVLGGPLRNYSKHRALVIVNAPDEQTARARLAEDPWMRNGVLSLIEIYRWEVLLGKPPER